MGFFFYSLGHKVKQSLLKCCGSLWLHVSL